MARRLRNLAYSPTCAARGRVAWCGEYEDERSRTITVVLPDGTEVATFCPRCSPQAHRDQALPAEGVKKLEDNVSNDLPLLLAVPRAAQLLGIGRAAAYRLVASGELPVKRPGGRVYIVTAGLLELVCLVKGTVYQRGSQWYFKFRSPEKDSATRKYPWITKGGFPTQKEAWTACRKAMREADRGRVVRAANRTVAQFLTRVVQRYTSAT